MTSADRERVIDIIKATRFFVPDEIKVAEELIDIYLSQPDQQDYQIVVIEDPAGKVTGYMTYGPTPLTEGTWDLYWIAVSPEVQGQGYGQLLVRYLENEV